MVDLGAPVGDQCFAQYGFLRAGEKWGLYDQLTFLDLQEINPVATPLAAPLATFSPGRASARGLGGRAAAAAVTSGDNEDRSNTAGTDDEADGDATETTTVGDDGSWSVDFTPDDLADTPDTLTIHGGSDDRVTVENAAQTSQTVEIEGESYEFYTVGDEGVTLIIDQDIDVVI
ncbi:hypothetical protein R3X27_14805 [Tropicimonas sp. TH_r6]|uniref:hypothetical protein n=1 Tax=Tropicimonas sp. TH_r6 TaxID=3082085 RepID=UPI002953655D|nr:hypothetical protein [Tropicimonas sp. TH_r6]MDV7143955.1 hypothetical protein [Tropicimonas sp. TH_r6]